ncbi:MAG: LptA/OstA family protein, partial [Candidatus Neomarinimicrobiota bacterium]|nr:LptA/OstA family protein [Candidatus Neomarinimicrobiota bacterium]
MKKFFVLVLFISIGIAQEKLILQQADLLQASVVNEETVTKLSGNIIFKKSDSILKSNFATQYDKSPLVKLNDNVVVTQENQTIYCDSLIYNKNTEAFSMYGNVRIDSDQRSMQSQEAQIDDKNEQIVLINDCEINEDNKHKIYGDKIILYFKNNELINFEVLSKGKVFTTNTGYEKKDKNTQDLVKIENENLLQAKHIFGEIKDNEINQLHLNGMASTFIHLYDDSLYQGNNTVSGDSISIKIENDTANKLVASGGTLGEYVPNKSNNNITEPINYSADVIEFEMDTQISKLYGSSKILHEDIDLSASHVNVNWETNILEAFTNNPLNQEENNRP